MDYTVPTTAGSFVRDDASAQSDPNDSTRSGYCSHGTQIIEYLVCGAICESSDHLLHSTLESLLLLFACLQSLMRASPWH